MIRVAAVLVAIVLLAPPAWAAGRRGHHHHHRTLVVGSAFYFGAPWYPHYYPVYYYGPFYEAVSEPPAMYVEKFEGQPDANSGEIYCPSLGEYYPDVQECANGWQRIIRPAG